LINSLHVDGAKQKRSAAVKVYSDNGWRLKIERLSSANRQWSLAVGFVLL